MRRTGADSVVLCNKRDKNNTTERLGESIFLLKLPPDLANERSAPAVGNKEHTTPSPWL